MTQQPVLLESTATGVAVAAGVAVADVVAVVGGLKKQRTSSWPRSGHAMAHKMLPGFLSQGLIRKYGIMMKRQEFREKAEEIGFVKYR